MLRMSTARSSTKRAWAALLALLLAVRIIASAGYMPSLEHGRLSLMLCPDGEWTVPAAAMPAMGGMGHDQGSKAVHHQECPYAAAAAISFAGGDAPSLPLPVPVFFLIGIILLPPLIRHRAFERPFSTGPPLPA
jgi:hypothetical protein